MSWLLVLLFVLFGGAVEVPAAGPPERVGTLVASWSEADDPVGSWPAEPTVVATDADRDALVASAPPRLRRAVGEVLERVDLEDRVAVVGGYAACLDHSTVGRDLSFVVVDDEPETLCAWSPWTVDLHVVPR